MDWEIDTLRLRLPPELLPRAQAITQEVVRALGQLPPPAVATGQPVQRLAAPTLRLDAGASNAQIGLAIAQRIGQSLTRGGRP